VWGDLYGLVYRNLRTHGVPHFDAEDLAQDILETAYIHLDTVDPGRRHAWLMTVTRNKLVDRARRSGRVDSVAEVPEAADPGLGPDEIALQSADRRVLLEAISRLPERDRQLLEVRYLEERSVIETANELGMTVGATKVALHRARERLRATLQATGTMGGEAMAGIAERAVRALSPYVGPTVADMCVRGTAVSIGKTFDTLTNEDAGAIEDRARRVLAPLLPPDTIERVAADIRGGQL
jgi:RNA polymerase sigma-70 factor (ECF subfamily)